MRKFLLAACLFAIASAQSLGCGGGTTQPPQGATALPDADGDGIPDTWEQKGVDYKWAPDGSAHHVDMHQLGASTTHKDIFVWVAWMQASGHTHRPDPAAIEIVRTAFKSAPLTNPDGYVGVNLRVVLAPTAIPEQEMLGGGDGRDYNWSEFDALKAKYFPSELAGAFYFCVFAHNIDTLQHSGITKTVPGRDLIVSLAGFSNEVGDTQEQAGTFMHELGHALGLHHGGTDDVNYKPNYVSIMNYYFQMSGLTIGGVQGNFDYSRFSLPAEHESTLNEKNGMSDDVALGRYGTYYFCCESCATNHVKPRLVKALAGLPVDFNCDGKFDTSVSSDINHDGSVTDLSSAADWTNVSLKPPSNLQGIAPRSATGRSSVDELTPADADRVPLFPVNDVHATVSDGSVVLRWQRVPLDRVLAYRVYRTDQAGEHALGTVDNTPAPEFVDKAPAKGAVKYFVTAVFAPHSLAAQRAPEAVPELVLFRPITSAVEIGAIRERAPTQTAEWERAGITAPPTRASAKPTKVLLETDRSEAAAVIVK